MTLKDITIIVLLVICIILGITYRTQRDQFKAERATYVLNDSLLQKKILSIRDSSNRHLTEYSIMAINYNQLLSSSSREVEQLKADLKLVHSRISDVNSSTTIHTVTHDTVEVPIDMGIARTDTGLKIIPFISPRKDSFNQITGDIHLHIGDSVKVREINLTYDIIGGTSITYFEKGGFFKKKELRLLVTENNPHTTINKVQTYYIHPDKKFYQKWWFHAACGSIVTIFAIHQLR